MILPIFSLDSSREECGSSRHSSYRKDRCTFTYSRIRSWWQQWSKKCEYSFNLKYVLVVRCYLVTKLSCRTSNQGDMTNSLSCIHTAYFMTNVKINTSAARHSFIHQILRFILHMCRFVYFLKLLLMLGWTGENVAIDVLNYISRNILGYAPFFTYQPPNNHISPGTN